MTLLNITDDEFREDLTILYPKAGNGSGEDSTQIQEASWFFQHFFVCKGDFTSYVRLRCMLSIVIGVFTTSQSQKSDRRDNGFTITLRSPVSQKGFATNFVGFTWNFHKYFGVLSDSIFPFQIGDLQVLEKPVICPRDFQPTQKKLNRNRNPCNVGEVVELQTTFANSSRFQGSRPKVGHEMVTQP